MERFPTKEIHFAHTFYMYAYLYLCPEWAVHFHHLALSLMTDSKLCLNLSSIQLALRSLPSLSYHFCIICKQSENEWKWPWNKVTLTYTVLALYPGPQIFLMGLGTRLTLYMYMYM